MSMEENKAIVHRFLEALDRQNFDALKEHPGLHHIVALTWSVLLTDQIVDGKIVLHHANADWISVFVKLGVISPPS